MDGTPVLPLTITAHLTGTAPGGLHGEITIDQYVDGTVQPVERVELYHRSLLTRTPPHNIERPLSGLLWALAHELLRLIAEDPDTP